jgi:hypothetical protein
MRGLPADRHTDERDLMAIGLVRAGVDRTEIARRTGMSKPYIGAVLSRICTADCAESGEPEDVVRIAYLPPINPRPKRLRGRFAGRY